MNYSNVSSARFREDIYNYMIEKEKVPVKEIYEIFSDGNRLYAFDLELKILIDKSKKLYDSKNANFYIERTDEFFLLKK